MRTDETNIATLMLTEFYELSKSDIEIQISKNYEVLRDMRNPSNNETTIKESEIENMIQKFYLSLSNYFSKNTGSDFTYDNANYSNFNSFKRNYLKFLKVNVKSANKVTT